MNTETLRLYLQGELSPEEAVAVEAAVANDPALADALARVASEEVALMAGADPELGAMLDPETRDLMPTEIPGVVADGVAPADFTIDDVVDEDDASGGSGGSGGSSGEVVELSAWRRWMAPVVALAAALLVAVITVPGMLDGGGVEVALPAYQVELSAGVAKVRGVEDADLLRLDPGNAMVAMIRPAVAAEVPVQAHVFVDRGEGPEAREAKIEVAGSGTVRVRMPLAEDEPIGRAALITLVGPASEAADEARLQELAVESGSIAPWVRVSQDFEVVAPGG